MGGAVVDDGPTGVKAPDGGWGWAVLFGCFVITGFSYAFPKAVSVFFKELIHEFGIGYSDTAWISSILLAMLYGTGEAIHSRATCPGVWGLAGFAWWPLETKCVGFVPGLRQPEESPCDGDPARKPCRV